MFCSISVYLTIGPAISCGNMEMYSPRKNGFFCTCAWPRYTSITYDIAWNVKNEIPIGSTMCVCGIRSANILSMLLMAKFRYLNMNRMLMLPITASTKISLRVPACSAFSSILPKI